MISVIKNANSIADRLSSTLSSADISVHQPPMMTVVGRLEFLSRECTKPGFTILREQKQYALRCSSCWGRARES